MAEIKFVSRENLVKVLGKIKETYVAKETGKGLSTNDLTNGLLAKINGMGTVATLNEIAESNLSADLASKVNTAFNGNHSHANKELLDTYTQTNADLADAVSKKHSHDNAEELALIVAGDKAKWDQAVTDVGTVGGKVTTLIGEDANKSVRTIAAEELAAKLIPEDAAESLNELQEIAAWIQAHPGDASAMNAAIQALQKQLQGFEAGEGTVKTYVDGAIAALKIGDYAKAADLTALANRVKAIEDDYVKASEMVAYTDAEIEEIWASV